MIIIICCKDYLNTHTILKMNFGGIFFVFLFLLLLSVVGDWMSNSAVVDMSIIFVLP